MTKVRFLAATSSSRSDEVTPSVRACSVVCFSKMLKISLAGNVVVVVLRFVSVVNISLFKSTLGMLDKATRCTTLPPPLGF